MYIRFTKSVHLHYRTRVSTLPHTHFRSPFRGCFRICGHDKSAPTAADSLPIMLEQIAIYTRTPTKNHTFALQKTTFCTTKNHTFAPQIPTFCTTKTILSHRNNPLLARQKPIGDKLGGSQKRFVKIIIVAETNISHT